MLSQFLIVSINLNVIVHGYSYQSGPDTYLLQLRDVDFPVRLREYMKVAAHRCPLSRDVSDRDNSHVDWRVSLVGHPLLII